MKKTSGCKKRHERIKTAKLMHSTHLIIVDERHNSAVAIKLSTRKYGGTPAMENIMYTLYKPGKTSTANNMRIEELRESGIKPKYMAQNNGPKHTKREKKIPTEHIQRRCKPGQRK
jgi:hypothetical protein